MKHALRAMAFLFVAIAGSFAANPASAGRFVIVNGEFLDAAQIERLQQLACIAIPNGNYWLLGDGLWGYAGDPTPRGRLGDYCRRRPSLSERGMLYSPGEILGE